MNDASAPKVGSLSLAAEMRVDAVCRRFEDAWTAGEQPRLGDYLAPCEPAEQSALLRELLKLDLDYRIRAGQTPTHEEYRPFPQAGDLIDILLRTTRTIVSSVPNAKTGSSGAAPSVAALPVVPGYEIVRELGRGGMGVVYQARHVSQKRLVALKVIHSERATNSVELPRFQREAEAAARLQHPNIVQIHDVGQHQGCLYLALEFVSGGSLKDRLNGSALPAQQAVDLVRNLAQAMDYAHQHGIIHQDLKPANVLLTEEDIPKVADLGLAKLADVNIFLSLTGKIFGTPQYMAPEQASGTSSEQAIGPATDVWALGVMLYEMLTGQLPFQGQTAPDLLYQVIHKVPQTPRKLNPSLDERLEAICLRCLRKDPRKRYIRAADLAQALAGCLERRSSLQTWMATCRSRFCASWDWLC